MDAAFSFDFGLFASVFKNHFNASAGKELSRVTAQKKEIGVLKLRKVLFESLADSWVEHNKAIFAALAQAHPKHIAIPVNVRITEALYFSETEAATVSDHKDKAMFGIGQDIYDGFYLTDGVDLGQGTGYLHSRECSDDVGQSQDFTVKKSNGSGDQVDGIGAVVAGFSEVDKIFSHAFAIQCGWLAQEIIQVVAEMKKVIGDGWRTVVFKAQLKTYFIQKLLLAKFPKTGDGIFVEVLPFFRRGDTAVKQQEPFVERSEQLGMVVVVILKHAGDIGNRDIARMKGIGVQERINRAANFQDRFLGDIFFGEETRDELQPIFGPGTRGTG